jgi:hypothetical protein
MEAWMSTNGQAQDEISWLVAQAKEIERLGDTVLRAAEGRRDLPAPLGEALKQIADLAGACEEIVADSPAEGLGQAALEALATALGAIRGGIDSLVVFQALEGTSYETRTVAND